MDFFELLKISTIGPQHLRLNEDVLRLIQEFMQEPKVLLICKHCECVLLSEKKNIMFMHIEYFTDIEYISHVCYNCSRFKDVKKYFGAENLDDP
uniref:Uncharacterized protein n=1 Tax=viral metagenome TaxID=1070528 RepID=A0A6C0IXF5_9ZZZZ